MPQILKSRSLWSVFVWKNNRVVSKVRCLKIRNKLCCQINFGLTLQPKIQKLFSCKYFFLKHIVKSQNSSLLRTNLDILAQFIWTTCSAVWLLQTTIPSFYKHKHSILFHNSVDFVDFSFYFSFFYIINAFIWNWIMLISSLSFLN